MKQIMNLQQKLEAKYLLTPVLKQSLDILKYSMQELEDYVKEVSTSNPLIEITTSHHSEAIELARLHYDKGVADSFTKGTTESFDVVNQFASINESIETYLMEQLSLVKELSMADREVIMYYIRSINNRGYLECDMKVVSDYFQLPITTCESLLKVLQSLEPVGIGARDLRECLVLQLVRMKDVPKLTITFVERHLEELADRKFQQLAHKYHITIEDVQRIFSIIQTLQPYPIIEIETTNTEYIIPDIIVEEFQGEYIVRINDIYIPKVSINSFYKELLMANKETHPYYKEMLSDALLLMKGLEQRHETLYKVTKLIINYQTEFIHRGIIALKPLRLKDISSILGLHESTVSRAISNKFIQTPKGTFPLKSLFMRGLKMNNGTVESTIQIKAKIKSIIQQENPKKPISDQKIANVLLSEGIQIARRTVAKYREELGILQSTKRVQK